MMRLLFTLLLWAWHGCPDTSDNPTDRRERDPQGAETCT